LAAHRIHSAPRFLAQVGQDQERPLVAAVGPGADRQADDRRREPLQRLDEADLEGRAVQPQHDHQRERHRGDHAAELADRLPGPQQAEVAAEPGPVIHSRSH
jgi:hypothetical protein